MNDYSTIAGFPVERSICTGKVCVVAAPGHFSFSRVPESAFVPFFTDAPNPSDVPSGVSLGSCLSFFVFVLSCRADSRFVGVDYREQHPSLIDEETQPSP